MRAAEAIDYVGAGTVEFIVDASDGLRADRFYFMEMNTRLQVEHPVTEAITGVDLVEWQLRVASGEGLPMRQSELGIDGHAFEARLYAEDAEAGFLPATGRLTHLSFPDGVRAETGVRAGDVISPWYDPMIAKVVVHGPTRAVALLSLERALAGTRVAGTVTNLAFLRRLAMQADFVAGRVDTGLIDRDVADLSARPVPGSRTRAIAAVASLGLDRAQPQEAFHLWSPLRWTARLAWRDEAIVAQVERLGAGLYRVEPWRARRMWSNATAGGSTARGAEPRSAAIRARSMSSGTTPTRSTSPIRSTSPPLRARPPTRCCLRCRGW